MRFISGQILGLMAATTFVALASAASPPHSASAAPAATVPPLPELVTELDEVGQKIEAYRYRIRNLYNSSQFEALEAAAKEARAEKRHFADGSWELYHFYDSLRCRDTEPESMWELHDSIHQAWIAAFPESITARVAHADFFETYGWHARGPGYAHQIPAEDWPIFFERVAKAHQILDEAGKLPAKCPMWWFMREKVGVSEGAKTADFARLFEEAKTVDPTFWYYDLQRAFYLLPQWYGEEGEWERAAESEIKRADGNGLEGYTRVVMSLSRSYGNIFQQTRASWRLTRDGLDEMRRKYPDSLEIQSAYAQLACLAGDRAAARKLFLELGGRVNKKIWGKQAGNFVDFRLWAFRDDGAEEPLKLSQ